ncbi:MAG: DEAD/DEAH box helicase [Cetobacterium sp.]|uniref:DEAD/DEAH box helicase n=1 Tax=Cetobacterium sp. TaxID=2071632 RepID=UPI003EE511BC
MICSNKDILNAWKFIESINLKSIPSSQKNFELSKCLSENSISSDYLYNIYLLPFENVEFYRYFRKIKNILDEIYEYSSARSYLFTFKLDPNRKIILDSIFIPDYAALLYERTMSIYNLEEIKKELYFKVYTHFELYSGKSLTDRDLNEIHKYFLELFRFRLNEFKFYDSYFIFLKPLPKEDSEKQLDNDINLNSFYIRDLNKIIEKGAADDLVNLFINGASKNQIDIDENKEEISSILQPKNIPIGKWPSSIKYQLSLMQSVAVNVAVNNMLLNKDLRITSVNGPPGTGKTTLLKDIFANIIVERAKIMTTFTNPEDAFSGAKMFLEVDDHKIYLNRLDEKLKGFEIVVASSNNGAVENISKELPQLSQVSRDESIDFNDLENRYESLYSEKILDLNLYSNYSDLLLGSVESSWGIFSAPLGKGSNIDSFFEKITPKGKRNIFSEVYSFQSFAKENWKSLIKEFNKKVKEIEIIKSELQKIYEFNESFNDRLLFNKEIKNYEEILEEIFIEEKKLSEVKREIENFPKPTLLTKLKEIIFNKNSSEYQILNDRENKILKKINFLNIKFNIIKEKYDKEVKRIQSIKESKKEIEKLCLKYNNLIIPDSEFWRKESYEKRQQQTPWLVPEMEGLRGELFILSLKIHKYFTAINCTKMRNQFLLISNRKQLNLNIELHREALKEAWHSLHLMFPVVSTTFASLSSMYNGIDEKAIGYLAIDEAGQASPQQAIGAIWRSKNVLCVGDPLQIEPVVTIDKMLLDDIANLFNIPQEKRDLYFGESSSVQQLADLASKYGHNKNGKWIGIPLWVHRRCIEPMFSISNKIAYDNKMVLPRNQRGNSNWLNCSGKVNGKQYIKEQGELLLEKLLFHWKENEEKTPNLYVITPFTEIKKEIQSLLRKELVKNLKDEWSSEIVKKWINNSVGTVHTFQGKEAEIVYFVCGTDETTKGAANWSCNKPNILNVAVTRAKKDFYIIGDISLFKDKQYYSVIFKEIFN